MRSRSRRRGLDPAPSGTIGFYARRFTHETLVHRADVSLALTGTFTAEPAVVIDGLDEWMELGSVPPHLDRDPRCEGSSDRTLRLHTGDVGNGETDWLVDMTGDVRLERVGFG